ncbi:hypothetical protein KO525_02930 [Psychrosphaera sp. B3R10]|uniref:hypothetical protein n=1 Tax=unclassified Psychrosphaera TaxID=2641570 RepID=UPI001C0831FA|nr:MULTISPECIES: hypothetical protein [unclassified Psychrosphaera]MBU2988327.1 hypothetical protein [Psychrosphaera sp. B3R10]MDO6718537.1 hypothetical protein [Psychrosphaera sp. 1_MG-2023]
MRPIILSIIFAGIIAGKLGYGQLGYMLAVIAFILTFWFIGKTILKPFIKDNTNDSE